MLEPNYNVFDSRNEAKKYIRKRLKEVQEQAFFGLNNLTANSLLRVAGSFEIAIKENK
jgi:hypothetical protein